MVLAYYLAETYSPQAQALFVGNPEPRLSELVELEFVSSLSRLARVESIRLPEARRLAALFDMHLQNGLYTRLELDTDHYRQAREYIARFDLPLKAPDALHLAVSAAEGLTLVTADRQLARNAATLGIDVELMGA